MRFIIESSFKSRAGYNGTCTVVKMKLDFAFTFVYSGMNTLLLKSFRTTYVQVISQSMQNILMSCVTKKRKTSFRILKVAPWIERPLVVLKRVANYIEHLSNSKKKLLEKM